MWSRGRVEVLALLFHDRGTRRGWVVNSTSRPHFTPGKDPVPIVQKAGWDRGAVWMDGKSRLHRDSIPDRPARSQSLYQLSYPAHISVGRYRNINQTAATCGYVGQSSSILEPSLLQNVRAFDSGKITRISDASIVTQQVVLFTGRRLAMRIATQFIPLWYIIPTLA